MHGHDFEQHGPVASHDALVQGAGEAMYRLVEELFPWHRAITGAGLRKTLLRLADEIPLELHEVPSGRQVFDFTVPPEWEIRDAWIADASGRRVVDYHESNLHVVSYSRPVRASMTWRELEPTLHSLPRQPELIPYQTTHFRDGWGFCLRHADRAKLAAKDSEERYEVVIDSSLKSGSLTYGEMFLPGETEEEVLLSAHVCHPSLANDNLSAVAVSVHLAKWLAALPRRRLSYRFVFAPATIGALAWLSRSGDVVAHVRHGLVLALLGDGGPLTYKRSRREHAEIDRTMACVLRDRAGATVRDFDPFGYDERQFCSPGFNLPMGRLTRTPNAEFPEYHTSADNLDLVRPAWLADSLSCCQEALQFLEANRTYTRTNPFGEPQLGRRGLYSSDGGSSSDAQFHRALLWILNLADGRHSLVDMAERSGVGCGLLIRGAELLLRHDLIRPTVNTGTDTITNDPKKGIP